LLQEDADGDAVADEEPAVEWLAASDNDEPIAADEIVIEDLE